MKSLIPAAAFSAIAMLAGQACGQWGGCGGTITHEFVVRLFPGQNIQQVCAYHDASVVSSYPEHGLYLLRSAGDDDHETEDQFGHDGRINFAEQDRFLTTPSGTTQSFFVSVTPDDYPLQPTVEVIDLDAAHSTSQGDGVVVAVLDTGISPHPLLQDQLLSGYNFVSGGTSTDDVGNQQDDNNNGLVDELVGHGTMVAGLVALVAPRASLMPVKVLDSDGVGNTFTVAAGIYYAVDHGAKVINLSLSSPMSSQIIADAVRAAIQAGCIVVAAAGNDNTSDPSFPGAYTDVVSVGATDSGDELAPFSNFGPTLSLCAPGVNVVSTFPGEGFRSASGTSFSSALVSGTAALLVARGTNSPALVRDRITSTCVDLDLRNPAYAGQLGHGRLSASGALAPACGSSDFDSDGDTGTDADIEAFFACLSGACCPTCGSIDFNGDGDPGTDADIEAFFRVLAGGGC